MGDAKEPTELDLYIGQRIRFVRREQAMTMAALGQAVGLTHQQIQKYEKGYNRIPASRLADIARVLNREPAHFLPKVDNLPAIDDARTLALQLSDARRAITKRIEDIDDLHVLHSILNLTVIAAKAQSETA